MQRQAILVSMEKMQRKLKMIMIGVVACVGILFLGAVITVEVQSAGPLYSYTDDRGNRVLTDNFERIPSQFHGKVAVISQEADPSSRPAPATRGLGRWLPEKIPFFSGGKVDVPGMTAHQSEILTYAGALAVLSLLGMNLSRSQGIRFLSLWCLIMLAIGTPVLLYVSKDGPGDVLKGKAAEIQEKQQGHLMQAQ